MFKPARKFIIAAILLLAPLLTLAVNDVTLNGIVSFNLNTIDAVPVPTTILGQSGGQVTSLNVQSNYIDVTLDNLSNITFNTTAGNKYFVIVPTSGLGFTSSPACITTQITLTGTGATTVVRLEVTSTQPTCATRGRTTPIFPINYSLSINSGATCTSQNQVTLHLAAQNATSVSISNNQNFIGSSFESFTNPTDQPWNLEAGDGIKTVYAIFKSLTGDFSPPISSSIELKSSGCGVTPPPVSLPTTTPPATTPPPTTTPPVTAPQTTPPAGNGGGAAGYLIKASPSTVYFYYNGKRYDFPNEKTYFSWYQDFSNIQLISDKQMASIPLGGNVIYKPGVKMLKITTDPKVYAVDARGVLRWIQTEEIVKLLYGDSWNKLVEDLPDAFFIDYKIGTPISNAADFNSIAVSQAATSINWNLGV